MVACSSAANVVMTSGGEAEGAGGEAEGAKASSDEMRMAYGSVLGVIGMDGVLQGSAICFPSIRDSDRF